MGVLGLEIGGGSEGDMSDGGLVSLHFSFCMLGVFPLIGRNALLHLFSAQKTHSENPFLVYAIFFSQKSCLSRIVVAYLPVMY
jgi:hypothetical protein